MKVELLKRLRKTHFIKYDMMSKQSEVHYVFGNNAKYPMMVHTPDVETAFVFYRKQIINAAQALTKRGPRKKLIDVYHAVKPKL